MGSVYSTFGKWIYIFYMHREPQLNLFQRRERQGTCVCRSPMVLQENFLSSAIKTSMSCNRPFRSHGDLFCFPPPPAAAVPFPFPPAPLVAGPLVVADLLLTAAIGFDEVDAFLQAT